MKLKRVRAQTQEPTRRKIMLLLALISLATRTAGQRTSSPTWASDALSYVIKSGSGCSEAEEAVFNATASIFRKTPMEIALGYNALTFGIRHAHGPPTNAFEVDPSRLQGLPPGTLTSSMGLDIEVVHSDDSIFGLNFYDSTKKQFGLKNTYAGAIEPRKTQATTISQQSSGALTTNQISLVFYLKRDVADATTYGPVTNLIGIQNYRVPNAPVANVDTCEFTVELFFNDLSSLLFLGTGVTVTDSLRDGSHANQITIWYYEFMTSASRPLQNIDWNTLTMSDTVPFGQTKFVPLPTLTLLPQNFDTKTVTSLLISIVQGPGLLSTPNCDATTVKCKATSLLVNTTGKPVGVYTLQVRAELTDSSSIKLTSTFSITIEVTPSDCATATIALNPSFVSPGRSELYVPRSVNFASVFTVSDPNCAVGYSCIQSPGDANYCNNVATATTTNSWDSVVTQTWSFHSTETSNAVFLQGWKTWTLRATLLANTAKTLDKIIQFEVVAPCTSSQIQFTLLPLTLHKSQSSVLWIEARDTHSSLYGDRDGYTLCGARVYSIGPTYSWLSVINSGQASAMKVAYDSTKVDAFFAEGTTLTVDLTASLLNMSVVSTQISVQINLVAGVIDCAQAVLTMPSSPPFVTPIDVSATSSKSMSWNQDSDLWLIDAAHQSCAVTVQWFYKEQSQVSFSSFDSVLFRVHVQTIIIDPSSNPTAYAGKSYNVGYRAKIPNVNVGFQQPVLTVNIVGCQQDSLKIDETIFTPLLFETNVYHNPTEIPWTDSAAISRLGLTTCGALVWQIQSSDGSAIDASVFTVDLTSANKSIRAQTSDPRKAGTYNMEVQVSYQNHPNVVSLWQPFSIVVANPCATAVITLTNVVSNAVISSTVGPASTSVTFNTNMIASSAPAGLCPAYQLIVVNLNDSSIPIDSSVETQGVCTSSNSNTTLVCATADRAKARVYSLALDVRYSDAANFYTNNVSLPITWTVVDPCLSASLALNPSTFAGGTYTLGSGAPFTWTWTNALLFTQHGTSIDCGPSSVFFKQSKGGNGVYTEVNATLPVVFVVDQAAKTFTKPVSSNTVEVGVYQVVYYVQLNDYPLVNSPDSSPFTFTVVASCSMDSLAVSSAVFSGTTITQNVYAPASAKTWTDSAAISGSGLTTCGALVWQIQSSGGSAIAIDASVFTVDLTSANKSIRAQTSDPRKAGTYNMEVQVSYQNHPNVVSPWQPFSIVVANPCATAVITLTNVVSNAVISSTVGPASTSVTFNTNMIASSAPAGLCPAYQLIVVNLNDSSIPIDSSVETQGVCTSSNSNTTLVCATTDRAKARVYSLALDVRYSDAANFYTNNVSLPITWTVVDPCLSASLALNPSTFAGGSYTLGSGAPFTWTWTNALPFTQHGTSIDCGPSSVFFKQSKGGNGVYTEVNATLPVVFVVDQAAKTFTKPVSSNTAEVGVYQIVYYIQLNDYPLVNSPDSSPFTFTVVASCSMDSLAVSSAVFSGTTITQNVYAPASVKTWTDSAAISGSGLTTCGALVWQIQSSGGSAIAIDASVFTVDLTSATKSIRAQTSDPRKAGTYNMQVQVSYQNHPNVVSLWQPFSIVVANPCATAVITLTNVVSNAVISSTVGPASTSVTFNTNLIASTAPAGLCPAYQLIVVNLNDSSIPIDSSVETQGVCTSSNSNTTLVCATTDRAKARVYSLALDVRYSDAANFYTNNVSLPITWTVVDPCLSASLALNPSTFAGGSYTLGSGAPFTWTWTNALLFTQHGTSIDCGPSSVFFKQSKGGNGVYTNVNASLPIVFVVDQVAKTFTKTVSSNTAEVGVYQIVYYVQLNDYPLVKSPDSPPFTFTVVASCSMDSLAVSSAVFSGTIITQNVYAPASVKTWTDSAAISGSGLTTCGALVWQIQSSGGSAIAIDASVFTVDLTSATKSIRAQTSDPSKAGTYNMQVQVSYQNHPNVVSLWQPFSIVVANPCATAVITLTNVVSNAVISSTVGPASTSVTFNTNLIASTAPAGLCPAYQLIVVNLNDSSIPIDSSVETQGVCTSSNSNTTLVCATTDRAKARVYSLALDVRYSDAANFYTNNVSLPITWTVVDPCLSASLALNPSTFAGGSYTLGSGAPFTWTWTNALLFTQHGTSIDCGPSSVFFKQSKGGNGVYTNVNASLPIVFVVDQVAKTFTKTVSSNTAEVGVYQIVYYVQLNDYPLVKSPDSSPFTFTVVASCSMDSLAVSSAVFSGTTITQNVYAPASVKTWTDSAAISGSGLTTCGALVWQIQSSGGSAIAIDASVFTVDLTSATKSIRAQTSDPRKAGTYNMQVQVSYQNHPNVVSLWQPFSIVVANPCATAVITLTNVVVSNAVISSTVGPASTSVTFNTNMIASSAPAGLCPAYQLIVVNLNDSSIPIDSSVETQGVCTSSNSNTTLVCATTDRAKARVYSLALDVRYSDAANFYTNNVSLPITWTVVDPCPSASLALNPSTFAGGTYTLGSVAPFTWTWTNALLFTQHGTSIDCGPSSVYFKQSKGGNGVYTEVNASLPIVFVVDQAAKTFTKPVSSNTAEIGVYQVVYYIQLNDYPLVKSPDSSPFTFTIAADVCTALGGLTVQQIAPLLPPQPLGYTGQWFSYNLKQYFAPSSPNCSLSCSCSQANTADCNYQTLDTELKWSPTTCTLQFKSSNHLSNPKFPPGAYAFAVVLNAGSDVSLTQNFVLTLVPPSCDLQLSTIAGVPRPEMAIATTLNATAFEVLKLVTLRLEETLDVVKCGHIGYSLANATQSQMLTTTSDGVVSVQAINDTALLGVHRIHFSVYLKDLDTVASKELNLTATLTVSKGPDATSQAQKDAIVQKYFVRMPPVPVDNIQPSYAVDAGSHALFTFSFADPLALELLTADKTTSGLLPDNILISVAKNLHPKVVSVVSVNYSDGVGRGSITLSVNATASTNAETAVDVALDVVSVGNEKLKSSFTISFAFKKTQQERPPDSTLLGPQSNETTPTSGEQQNATEAAVDPAVSQQMQFEAMDSLLKAALDETRPSTNATLKVVEEREPEQIKVKLKEVNQVGSAIIAFEPPIVAIPNDWHKMWDLSEREKMSPKQRAVFEEGLMEILHVQFVQNSEERPQRYMMSNLTRFEPDGIRIEFNFSDPIFVSQGANADQVKIKLLKSYFTQPNTHPKQGRSLATVSQDDKYITITEAIPRQIVSASDVELLSESADTVSDVFTSTFVLTFLLNLFLNGVMSQLWNVFNTVQIILVLPMLAVMLPANAMFALDIIDQVVNFKPIDKKVVQEKLMDPIFGRVNQSSVTANESPGLVAQVFVVVALVIVVFLLIGLLIFCRKKVYPKCCNCFKRIVTMLQAKLMFNSVLRALIQSYLLTSISVWKTLRGEQLDLSTSESKTDLAVAIVLLVGLIAYPIWIKIFLTKSSEQKLRDPAFKQKFDSVYQNLDYYKSGAFYHTSWFLVRRLLFAALIVFASSSIVLQVLLADVLSTLLLAYFFTVKPMVDGINNFVQIVNEIVVLLSIQLMFLATDYVPDPQTRYDLFWYFLYILGFDICVNVSILIFTVGKKVYLSVKGCLQRRLAKKQASMRVEAKKILVEKAKDLGHDAEDKISKRRLAIHELFQAGQDSKDLSGSRGQSSSNESQSQSQSHSVNGSSLSESSQLEASSLSKREDLEKDGTQARIPITLGTTFMINTCVDQKKEKPVNYSDLLSDDSKQIATPRSCDSFFGNTAIPFNRVNVNANNDNGPAQRDEKQALAPPKRQHVAESPSQTPLMGTPQQANKFQDGSLAADCVDFRFKLEPVVKKPLFSLREAEKTELKEPRVNAKVDDLEAKGSAQNNNDNSQVKRDNIASVSSSDSGVGSSYDVSSSLSESSLKQSSSEMASGYSAPFSSSGNSDSKSSCSTPFSSSYVSSQQASYRSQKKITK